MPRKFPHEEKTSEDEENGELPEEAEELDEDSSNPVAAILAIIDKYYEGLKREKEGMGVD